MARVGVGQRPQTAVCAMGASTLVAMENWTHLMLEWLALPQFGLSTVFIVSFISATLLPLGSEPAVFGLIKLTPTCTGLPLPWPRWATPWAAA